MKYLIFGIAYAAGIPLMAFAAAQSERMRGWLLTALILSTALGDMAGINFWSMEHYRGPERGFEVTLTDLIAWGTILGLLIRFPGKLNWLPYNSLWMFAFFGFAFFSTFWAKESLFAYFGLFEFIRVYLVFWCVVNLLRVGTPRKYIWTGLVTVAWMVTLVALKQKYLDGIYRVPGLFDHSNTNPSFLNLIVPVLLIWGLCERKFSRFQILITLGAVFGMVFTVTATLSRAGVLLSIACIVGALVIVNLRARSRRVVATSALIFMGMLAGGVKAADTLIERFQEAPRASGMARGEFNGSAYLMLRDEPAGVGLNNFSRVLTTTPSYKGHFVVMAGEEQAGVVHNIYLLTAAEVGYAGLAVFVIILLRFAWLAGRGAWRLPPLEGLLLAGVLIGFCSLYAVGFLEWTLRITPVFYMFAIVSALCVGFAERGRAARAAMRRSTDHSAPQPQAV